VLEVAEHILSENEEATLQVANDTTFFKISGKTRKSALKLTLLDEVALLERLAECKEQFGILRVEK
jgi:hypothetical protein